MKRKWIAALGILISIAVLAAVLVYFFVYNKPQPDYAKKKPDFEVSAADLLAEFKNNTETANQKYNGKVLLVSGVLSYVEQSDSLLIAVFAIEVGLFGDEGVRMAFIPEFNDEISAVLPGSQISVKGYCTGYNEVDVIMEHCSIPEK
jgi:hypothetical protein